MGNFDESEGNAFLRNIFQSNIASIMTFEASENFPLLSISENAEQIYGFKKYDFEKDNLLWHSRIHPDDYDAVVRCYTEKVVAEKKCELEFRFRHKNGHYIWLRNYIQLGQEEPSWNRQINVISSEISKPEGTVYSGLKSFQSALNNADRVFFQTDNEGNIVYLNNAWEKVTGFRVETSLGRKIQDYIYPNNKEKLENITGDIDKEHESQKIRFLTKQGDLKPAEVCSFVSTNQKNMIDIFGTITEISIGDKTDSYLKKINKTLEQKIQERTEELQNKNALLVKEINRRKKVESASLAEHKELELLKSAILHVTDGVVINSANIVDKNGPEILFVNEAYEKMTGFNKDELIGNYFNLLHGPKTDPDVLRNAAKRLKQLRPFHFELINYNKNGEPYWVEVKANPIINKDGNCTHWVGIHRDITARKQIEEKLANNEKKYRSLFDLSFDAIIQMGLDWKINDVNKSACRLFGYSLDEFRKLSMYDLMPEEKAQKLAKNYSEDLLTGDSFIKTLKKRKDGTTFAVEVSTKMVQIEGEKQIIAYIRDISEKEKIVNDLLRNKYSLDNAQRMAKIGSWEIDKTSNRLFWSDEIMNILGLDDDVVVPSRDLFASFIHPDDRNCFENAVDDLVRNNNNVDIVHRLITKHGQELMVHSIGMADLNDDGKVVKLYGTTQDITEQFQDKQRLQLLTTAVESADNGIVITGMTGDIVWVNHAFTNLTGYSREEAIGKNPRILNSGVQDQSFFDKLWETILSGKTWNGQIINRRKDGILYVEEMSITPVKNTAGEITNFIAIKRDITEKRKYHLRLEESLKEKEVLLAEVHHRVKNNLAMISGLLYLQMNTVMNDEVKRILSLSQSRIQSIALIHELLYQSDTLSTIHFSEFIEKLLRYLKDVYGNTDVDIRVGVKSDDIILNVNQAIPSALLINEMVINAYEHAFDGKSTGEINIRSELINNQVCIEVSDNGVGLPKNYNEMKSNTLGLKLIKTLARQLSAALDNVNIPGEGTTFRVQFELKQTPEPVRLF